MRIGNREFDVKKKCYVMGILNLTPDSFSDGGYYTDLDKALFRVEEMIREGVDIVDIGGESTRPGYDLISPEEEMERVLPAIERIKATFDTPLSIDTYKNRVAEEALKAGADMVNDIWGLVFDDCMGEVIERCGAVCCLMHNRMMPVRPGMDFMLKLKEDLEDRILLAEHAGIPENKIILDPGIGFGKTQGQNLVAMRELSELKNLGFPLLLGASRKSVIGHILDLPVEERLEGTIVTTVYAVMSGCSFVRVHDIKENVRAIQMTEAILGR